MTKMAFRQTHRSGRVRCANSGGSAGSSERLEDRLVTLAGIRLMDPYSLQLNDCLICLKPLLRLKPYQAIWILMSGACQISRAFFRQNLIAARFLRQIDLRRPRGKS